MKLLTVAQKRAGRPSVSQISVRRWDCLRQVATRASSSQCQSAAGLGRECRRRIRRVDSERRTHVVNLAAPDERQSEWIRKVCPRRVDFTRREFVGQ